MTFSLSSLFRARAQDVFVTWILWKPHKAVPRQGAVLPAGQYSTLSLLSSFKFSRQGSPRTAPLNSGDQKKGSKRTNSSPPSTRGCRIGHLHCLSVPSHIIAFSSDKRRDESVSSFVQFFNLGTMAPWRTKKVRFDPSGPSLCMGQKPLLFFCKSLFSV